MSAHHVRCERRGSVAVLRLDRPPANALELEIGRQTGAALDQVLATDAAAIVVTGTGGFFSAGLDLKVIPSYGADEQRAMIATANELLGKLYQCPLPVVAGINGHAIAGGLVLALACDYRVGARGACKLGLTEARAGIPFPAVAMAIVQAELTGPAARILTLQARNLDPERALVLGVVDELEPPDEVLARAVAVAEDLGTIPRDAYRRIKQQLRASVIARIREVVATGTDPMLASWFGPETASAAHGVLLSERGT